MRISRKLIADIQASLLAHYAVVHRRMPWRGATDPYAIWVSEVMLQQTQTATAAPFYERFLKRFPTVRALADADEAAVLELWSGLGYYTRARNLWIAARRLCAERGGEVPGTASELRELPGVGRYTAGAIASIAFGKPEPAVDGNVQRVISRLFAIRGDVSRGRAHEQVWRAMRLLLPTDSPGAFNQAMMEFGATVCVPTAPRCGKCPLASHCAALRTGRQNELPEKAQSKKTVRVAEACAVIARNAEILIVKRPAGGQMAGLWEFPRTEVGVHESAEDAAVRAASLILERSVQVTRRLPVVRHQIMHRAIALHPILFLISGEDLLPAASLDREWVSVGDLTARPVVGMVRKVAEHLTLGAL